jgi:SOS response regulatory protein OraA/RecX
MKFPRTAVYINRVSKAYSAVRILQIDAQHHAARMDFEAKYATDLTTAFERLYKAAQGGSASMLLKSDDFLMKEDVQAYMRSKGFSYDPRMAGSSTIEWWHAKEKGDELK